MAWNGLRIALVECMDSRPIQLMLWDESGRPNTHGPGETYPVDESVDFKAPTTYHDFYNIRSTRLSVDPYTEIEVPLGEEYPDALDRFRVCPYCGSEDFLEGLTFENCTGCGYSTFLLFD